MARRRTARSAFHPPLLPWTVTMRYDITYNSEAQRDMRRLSPDVARRVAAKIEQLRNDLSGNVKRLKDFVPEYRLRVGDWRVLFEVDGDRIVIYHVSHRSVAYE